MRSRSPGFLSFPSSSKVLWAHPVRLHGFQGSGLPVEESLWSPGTLPFCCGPSGWKRILLQKIEEDKYQMPEDGSKFRRYLKVLAGGRRGRRGLSLSGWEGRVGFCFLSLGVHTFFLLPPDLFQYFLEFLIWVFLSFFTLCIENSHPYTCSVTRFTMIIYTFFISCFQCSALVLFTSRPSFFTCNCFNLSGSWSTSFKHLIGKYPEPLSVEQCISIDFTHERQLWPHRMGLAFSAQRSRGVFGNVVTEEPRAALFMLLYRRHPPPT